MRTTRQLKIIFWAVTVLLLVAGLASVLVAKTPADKLPAGPLVISELMASNSTALADEDGDFPDWVEIRNISRQPVNLAGWSLSDDPAQPQKWAFPDMTLPAGEHLVVFASGKNRTDPKMPLHTNFRLRRDGEFLGLYSVHADKFVDALSPQFPPQLPDVAYGRVDPQTEGYLDAASPGQENNVSGVSTAILPSVEFNPPRGFYNAPTTVELSTTAADTDIRYTTDGSEPTQTNGQIYSDPIEIGHTTFIRAAAFKDGHLPSPVNTHSYIFMENVINQPPNPPNWPNTWGVYLDYRPYLPPKGDPVPADYQMDSRITGDEKFGPQMEEGLTAIPSLSLVTAPQNYDIYIDALERGKEWERPVSIEWIDPNNPAGEFQIDAGMRMQGVSARWEFMPKKSFRLYFRGQYGSNNLNAPIFGDSPVTEFDTLVLRGGANRSYAGYPADVDYTQVTYTRDEWMRASQIEMSGVGAHGTFVHLYLNGLYWGLYNLVERPDPAFAASYLGGDEADWFGIKHGATVLNPEEVAQGAEPQLKMGEAISGTDTRFEEMLALLEQGNLANPANYATMKQYVDTAHFADYIILNLYAGNNDWGDNNWFIAMQNNPPGPLKYFMWDGEVTWNEGARLYLGKETEHHRMRPLFLALMENPDFTIEFADRLYKHLFNNGALTDENSQARWREINQAIAPAMVAESARWGDVRYTDNPVDPDDWQRAVKAVLGQMKGNADKLVSLTRQAEYYPPIDPPEFSQHGGSVSPGFELALSASDGDIFYTVDGSDPRTQVNGGVAGTANKYSNPIVITETTIVKARLLEGDTWSALRKATFVIGETPDKRLQITEINYNPPGGDEYEFIELKNTGLAEFDLSGAAFEGINFAFPVKMPPLEPGQSIVLAHDYHAFSNRYPGVPVAGVFEGQLANQGETITLRDTAGNVIFSVSYDDENGWPVSPDGQGDSLHIVDPAASPDNAKNWQAGPPSPGEDDE